jgi:lysozyme
MNIEKVSARLVADEGIVLSAYQDHLGYWTIGVGTLIDERKGGGITQDESRYLLRNRIRRVEAEAAKYPWYESLDEARQGVVICMIFQLGADGFGKFKNTIKYIAAGEYIRAANGMLDSLWAKQTPERAKRMANVMRTGEWL